jgi:LysM repeat protein
MVQRTKAAVFWRVLIVITILVVVGGVAFTLFQFSSGSWQLFTTQTPTPTFTATLVVPTATLFVPSDTPTITPTPTRSGPVTYIVVEGDTFISIAAVYEVDLAALMAYNNLESSILAVGQEIIIPPPAYTFEAPTTTPIPTGLRAGTEIEYRIKAGDVLGSIAEQFGARVDDIMIINQITDPNSIQVGQVIKIPYNSLTNTPITPTRTPIPTNTRRPSNTPRP